MPPIKTGDLGVRLAEARKVRGWTGEMAFRRSGVPADLIEQIETGTVVRPGLGTLIQLVAAYDLPLGELMALAGYEAGPLLRSWPVSTADTEQYPSRSMTWDTLKSS